jgi:hypothetical protein
MVRRHPAEPGTVSEAMQQAAEDLCPVPATSAPRAEKRNADLSILFVQIVDDELSLVGRKQAAQQRRSKPGKRGWFVRPSPRW